MCLNKKQESHANWNFANPRKEIERETIRRLFIGAGNAGWYRLVAGVPVKHMPGFMEQDDAACAAVFTVRPPRTVGWRSVRARDLADALASPVAASRIVRAIEAQAAAGAWARLWPEFSHSCNDHSTQPSVID
jgi:hypothetical protein